MFGFSVQEMEELGKALGNSLRAQMGNFSLKEDDIKKYIEAEMREILKKSSGRGAPWSVPLPPLTVLAIEKRLHAPAGTDEISKRLQDWNDNLYLLTKMLNVAPHQLRTYDVFKREFSELAKALNTSGAGEGAEWIPDMFSSQMIEMIELTADVAGLFYSFPMPFNPYTFPVLLGDGTAYKGAEATTDSPQMFRTSNAQTSNLTFNAVKLITNYPMSDEITEDSIVPILPVLRASIARSQAKGLDNAIINGDTSTTHQDSDVTDSMDARKSWKGIRKCILSASKVSGASWAHNTGVALLASARKALGIRGLVPSDLVWLVGTLGWNDFYSQDEVRTVDKFGGKATIVNGVLTAIDGVTIKPSQHIREDLNASGVYDNTTITKHSVLLVHKPSFWRGTRKGVTVEMVRKPEYGNSYLIAQSSQHFKPIYDETTLPLAAEVYAMPN
jgi:hypothetical protein